MDNTRPRGRAQYLKVGDNGRRIMLYGLVLSACVVVAVLSIFIVPPLVERNSIRTVMVNGKVLVGYPNSVPVGLTFRNGHMNYSAIVGDLIESCACGGYYYMVTLPNEASFNVSVYYTVNNTTRACETSLTISSVSDILSQPINCP